MDVLSINAGEYEDSPLHPPAYMELAEIVTRTVAKLNIEWPHKKQEVQKKKKIVSWMSASCNPDHSLDVGAYPFFPICIMSCIISSHVSSFTVHNYSGIQGAKENSYGTMPQVEAAPVCNSLVRSSPGSSREGPFPLGPSMVLRHHFTPGRPPVGDSHLEGPAFPV